MIEQGYQQEVSKPHRWEKGVSGNPAGRPRNSFSLSDVVRQKLQTCPKESQKTYAELLVESILHKATVDNDVTSHKLIWNYMDGLPSANLEVNQTNVNINVQLRPAELSDRVANLRELASEAESLLPSETQAQLQPPSPDAPQADLQIYPNME